MQKEIRKTISKIKETGLQLLFPGRCPVCDGIVRPFGRKICPECLPKLKPVTAPWCMRCGKKLAEEREYCGDCMHREHKYDRARTLYEYRDVAPSIYRFKYSGRQEYGDFFGEEMARLLGDFIGRVRPDVIVPVPLYRGKLRKRGYNQAACLASVVRRPQGGTRYAAHQVPAAAGPRVRRHRRGTGFENPAPQLRGADQRRHCAPPGT